jgi:hypothetical protein
MLSHKTLDDNRLWLESVATITLTERNGIEVNWPEVMWRTIRLACSSWSRTLRLCLVLLIATGTLAALLTIARLARS